MATEDPSDPAQLAARRRRLADLTVEPLQAYNEGAELLARTADGAIARVTYQALFTCRDGVWRYAGPLASEVVTPSAIIRAHLGVDAGQFVTITQQVYAQITADLGLTLTQPVVLELYADAAVFLAPASLPDDA